MTSNADYLRQSTLILDSQGVATARLDTLIIMEFILSIDRSKILAEPNKLISDKYIKLLDAAIAKRAKHIPIAYITNNSEFYGRNFFIDERVLEPRSESETMIDVFKGLPIWSSKRSKFNIADIGTGSGALGITAALEVRGMSLDLLDIDQKALEVAKKNVVIHAIKANLARANLLVGVNKTYDVLLCNLPYVPDDFHINLAASHEPKIAIFGGADGLDVYRKLFKSLQSTQRLPLYILTEALPFCHKNLTTIARSSGYECEQAADFIQLFKRTN